MDDMNSRYKRPDGGATIRTNTGGSMYGDMNIMEADNDMKTRQTQRASATRGHSGRGAARTRRQTIIYLVIIITEIIILAGIWTVYFTNNSGSKSKSKSKGKDTVASEDSGSSSGGSVNVNNDNFTLTCTKVSISSDTNGSPVAVIYFTFANKTENPLSMSEVFSPMVAQNGANLDTNVSLANDIPEMANKDTQISSGDSLDCAYAFALSDSTSTLTLTMHDNYETFSDIGSTEIPIS